MGSPGVVFVGHDPGALNHVRPLRARAEAAGVASTVCELRPGPGEALRPAAEVLGAAREALEAQGASSVALVVGGISTNSAELAVLKEAKESCGARTALLVDFAPGHRLEGAVGVDAVLCTNAAAAERANALVPGAQTVAVVGSTFLETLAVDAAPPSLTREKVREAYGVSAGEELVPLFLAPTDMVPDCANAVVECVRVVARALADAAGQGRGVLLLRPHPRLEADAIANLKDALPALACRTVLADFPPVADNKSVYKSSKASLSMGSTVSLECLAYGCPSAYAYCGWDVSRIEAIMGGLPVERLVDVDSVSDFLRRHLAPAAEGGRHPGEPFDVESCMGASERGWEQLHAML